MFTPQASSLLYSVSKEGLIPAQPKVWWINLGQQDLDVDGCSLDTLHAGLYQIVQQLQSLAPRAHIVLSPPSSSDTKLHTHWNERLKCLAQQSSNQSPVQVYDPYHAEEKEEDDDFFVDVSSGGSSVVKVLAPEEALQAIVEKVQELLQ